MPIPAHVLLPALILVLVAGGVIPTTSARGQAATPALIPAVATAAARQITVTVRVSPYAQVEATQWNPHSGPFITYSGNPADLISNLPGVGPAGLTRYTWLSFRVDRNCNVALRAIIKKPFTSLSDERTQLPTGVEIWYGDTQPLVPAGARLVWTPSDRSDGGEQLSASVSRPVPAEVAQPSAGVRAEAGEWDHGPFVRYFLLIWAGFGPEVSSQTAGTYAGEFSVVIEQAD
ncbi:MAG: hypothetical protein IMX01_06920 [Limnochordaceae bacterium]|nr:hypothetical protein [Limnochordaceae bacterium]